VAKKKQRTKMFLLEYIPAKVQYYKFPNFNTDISNSMHESLKKSE
jgi:hypothetical protein